jgi:riboflavin biosynthesis pyrimidine reductase
MEFARVVPPGPPAPPETLYTGLELGRDAPADRPYVVCNFVSSADGKATAQGRTALLGGDGDRVMFHLLRTQTDAVVAGTGTLRVERYGALVRDPRMLAIREREGRAAQPLAVVISRRGEVPFDIPLFADARARVAIYAPASTVVPDVAASVTLHETPEGGLAGVLRSLRHDYDLRSLLCEGGPALFDAMLAQSLVDELFLTLAPALVGGEEIGITTGPGLPGLLALRLASAFERDGHLFLRYALGG